MSKRNPYSSSGSPTMSQRLGLLTLALLMLAALVILLFRQEGGKPAKSEAELIPLRQMQQYKAVQATSDSAHEPQVSHATKKSQKGKTHKTPKRGQPRKAQSQPAPPRKINEETLTPQ